MYKLAILTSHPIQYQAPLFRKLAKHPEIDLMVYFCWAGGAKEMYDKEFGQKIKWDIPLLEGYKYKFLKNYSLKPSPSFWGQINFGIVKEIIKNKYEAIIISGYNSFSNWLAFFACWLSRTPVIFRGEADFSKKINPFKKIIKTLILIPLFKTFSAFLYSYSKNKEYFQAFGAMEDKLFFYPCAVDNEFFQEQAKKLNKKELRKKYQIPEEKIVVLFVGKLIKRKRPKDILKAISKIRNNEKIFVVFVGDGLLKNELKKISSTNKIGALFCGFKNQKEISEFYKLADIFVLPSEYDPSPKALNEAMNFKLIPVVSNKIGTAKDLIKENKTGFIFSCGDIEKLSNILEKLTNNKNLREKIGENAFELVNNWSFENDILGILKALKYIYENKY